MAKPAKLVLYKSDTLEKIESFDFGNEYKNSSNNLIGFYVYNEGERAASDVVASWVGYRINKEDGSFVVDETASKWKSLSYSSDGIFTPTLDDLPEIPPGSYMPGYKVVTETFDSMAGRGKDMLPPWLGVGDQWEAYSAGSYLHHRGKGGPVTARLYNSSWESTTACEVSVDISATKYGFAGVQLQMDETTGYGYLILVIPDPIVVGNVNTLYGQLPDFQYIDVDQHAVFCILKGKNSDVDINRFDVYDTRKYFWLPKGTGPRDLNGDKFKVKLEKGVIDVWYNNEYKGRYVDPDPIQTPGKMAFIADRGIDHVNKFDNVQYRAATTRGIIYAKSTVPADAENQEYFATLKLKYRD